MSDVITEESIVTEMGRSGWVGEREPYYLAAEVMRELTATAGLQQHVQRAAFEASINHVVADFCLGLMRYDDKKTNQKITTSLAQKAKKIAQATEALLAKIEPLTDDELHWMFGHAFENREANVVLTFERWLQYTRAFQRYAEIVPIDVKRSTPPLMRVFVVRCIYVLEHFISVPIIRRRADEQEADAQMIHDFMASLLHHLPADVKEKLPQPVSSLEGVVREAIEIVRAQEKQVAKNLTKEAAIN